MTEKLRISVRQFFLVLLAGACVSSYAAVHQLSADTLALWIAQGPPASFILVDVRETSEIASVIGTAACRPYNMAWNSGVLRAQYALLPKTAAVVLYCASGHRSPTAASFLDSLGYQTVYSLVNGFGAWTGPVQPSSSLRPLSDLPAYSMTAGSSVALPCRASDRWSSRLLHCNAHGFEKRDYSLQTQPFGPCDRRLFDIRGGRIPLKVTPSMLSHTGFTYLSRAAGNHPVSIV